MTGTPSAPLVPCPTCSRRVMFSRANRWRPFCSERCRDIDLGAWASERFRVPLASPPDDADDTEPHPRQLPGG
ncbi:MAG: DNA gyrase inhibitor YacG [Burkholderiaceae bacterium]|nr:MAG: DNA gyrase inhibitor YacG [Burkholderiaceae bacterium]MBE7426066.1 DNA gyrase inhibitor YacG [Ideonella sp.]MCC7287730.1 DNA gyrase inhibitor YacG [Burkholderiaceae bacterium]